MEAQPIATAVQPIATAVQAAAQPIATAVQAAVQPIATAAQARAKEKEEAEEYLQKSPSLQRYRGKHLTKIKQQFRQFYRAWRKAFPEKAPEECPRPILIPRSDGRRELAVEIPTEDGAVVCCSLDALLGPDKTQPTLSEGAKALMDPGTKPPPYKACLVMCIDTKVDQNADSAGTPKLAWLPHVESFDLRTLGIAPIDALDYAPQTLCALANALNLLYSRKPPKTISIHLPILSYIMTAYLLYEEGHITPVFFKDYVTHVVRMANAQLETLQRLCHFELPSDINVVTLFPDALSISFAEQTDGATIKTISAIELKEKGWRKAVNRITKPLSPGKPRTPQKLHQATVDTMIATMPLYTGEHAGCILVVPSAEKRFNKQGGYASSVYVVTDPKGNTPQEQSAQGYAQRLLTEAFCSERSPDASALIDTCETMKRKKAGAGAAEAEAGTGAAEAPTLPKGPEPAFPSQARGLKSSDQSQRPATPRTPAPGLSPHCSPAHQQTRVQPPLPPCHLPPADRFDKEVDSFMCPRQNLFSPLSRKRNPCNQTPEGTPPPKRGPGAEADADAGSILTSSPIEGNGCSERQSPRKPSERLFPQSQNTWQPLALSPAADSARKLGKLSIRPIPPASSTPQPGGY